MSSNDPRLPGRQGGMTFGGILLFLLIGGFFARVALQLVPVYLSDFKVKEVMESLVGDPTALEQGPPGIRTKLDRKLYVNEVRDLDLKLFKIHREANGFQVDLNYEVRKPILGNVDAIVSFHHSVTLGRP